MAQEKPRGNSPRPKNGQPNGDGLKKASQAMKIAGGVVTTAKGVIDLISLIRNHPEWYTHYETSNLVNMNLSNKQYTTFEALSEENFNFAASEGVYDYIAMPSVYEALIQLTTPQGDEGGWKTGVRRLYQQLRTANSGRINFDVHDLEKYIQNVRALHAIFAYLRRLYAITYTFKSTNASLPTAMLEACEVQAENILSNAADLFMYVQRFGQQVKVSFPLNIDYYRRTEWLFGNVFVDDNGQKPSFLVPTMSWRQSNAQYDSNGIVYYTFVDGSWAKKITWQFSPLMDYAQLVTQCEQIKNDLLEDPMMSIIAGDIIKAFGDKAFMDFTVWDIDQSVPCVYDEDALTQIQNANVLCAQSPNGKDVNGDAKHPNTDYKESIDSSGWITATIQMGVSSGADDTIKQKYFSAGTATMLQNKFNSYLLNWHENSITPGQIMSITRLTPTNATLYEPIDETKTKFGLQFGTFGTEFVVDIFCFQDRTPDQTGRDSIDTSGRFDNLTEHGVVPIAGNILLVHTTTENQLIWSLHYIQRMLMEWANLDWAPRYRVCLMLEDGDTLRVQTNGPDVLDWNVFAEVQAEAIANYLSYSNQSLLYAGNSQNQSNRQVYKKEANKGVGKPGSDTGSVGDKEKD